MSLFLPGSWPAGRPVCPMMTREAPWFGHPRITIYLTLRFGWGPLYAAPADLRQPLPQAVAHAQRVRHDGQPRVHSAGGREEARVHHVQVIDVVRFAVAIQRGRLRVRPESDRPVLVRNACERNPLAQIQDDPIRGGP